MTADERRESVLAVADHVFAERGFAATPTMAVANAAGISHAYLFRLFETKSDLTLAVVRRTNERLGEAVEAALATPAATGEPLIRDRDLLIMHLHSIVAAISDDAVRDEMRRSFARLSAVGAKPTVLGTLEAVINPGE